MIPISAGCAKSPHRCTKAHAICFASILSISSFLHLFAPSTLTFVSGLFPLFLYTILLITVHHWTLRPCPVHYFALCHHHRSLFQFTPLHSYSVHIHNHSIICSHISPSILGAYEILYTCCCPLVPCLGYFAGPGLLLLPYSLINQRRFSTNFW